MTITPVELRNFQFAKKMRGYDPIDVDAVIDEAATELEILIAANKKLQEDVDRLQERLKTFENMEGSLRQALVKADEAAKQQQEAVSREANLKLREVEAEIERKLYSSRREIDQATTELAELKQQKRAFVAELKALVKTHLRLLEEGSQDESNAVESDDAEEVTVNQNDNRPDDYGSYPQDQ